MPVSTTALTGLKQICAHTGKSHTTLRKLIREYDFPAAKVGGEWISDMEMIRRWRMDMIGSAATRRREVKG